jgi:hypothetical protein
MMRGALLVLIAACGSRTELLAPEPVDASIDVPHDTAHDVAHDVQPDAPPIVHGCADGQREGFVDDKKFPDIAGCSGGFLIGGVMPFHPASVAACPSVVPNDTTVPACNRGAGDDGANPKGAGCNVADLCEAGWHVCASSADVAKHSPSGCNGATQPSDPPLFFVTRQSSNGCAMCATGTSTASDCDSKACVTGCAETERTSNDAFGCGNVAPAISLVDCDPLDSFTNNLCNNLSGSSWSCAGDPTGFCEAYVLVHLDSSFGGALCCRD